MSMKGFDPKGKAALFSTEVQAAPDQIGTGNAKEGKDALYSTGPRQVGTAVIRCSACKAQVRTSLVDVGVRLLSISAWIPGRRHSHWMRCPTCQEHNWCSIAWNG